MGASTVVLRLAVSSLEETVEISRVKDEKVLMLRCVPITSERMTSPLGGLVEGGPLSSSLEGSWMPGFMIASCWLLVRRLEGGALEGDFCKGRTRRALVVRMRLEARMALDGLIV